MDSSKLLRTLTVNKGTILAPLIDQYQARGEFPPSWEISIRNNKVWDPYFHPSSDCFTDPVTLYLEKTDRIRKRKISPNLQRTFDCGHMWHGYIQSILIDMGLVAPSNVEQPLLHEHSSPSFIGKGTADLVDVHIPGHGYWLVDIKTMRKDDFGAPSELTMKKYFAQVNCYGDWLDTEKMLILGICKDSPHEFREWIVQKDTDTLSEIYDRWAYVAECISIGVEPDPDMLP